MEIKRKDLEKIGDISLLFRKAIGKEKVMPTPVEGFDDMKFSHALEITFTPHNGATPFSTVMPIQKGVKLTDEVKSILINSMIDNLPYTMELEYQEIEEKAAEVHRMISEMIKE